MSTRRGPSRRTIAAALPALLLPAPAAAQSASGAQRRRALAAMRRATRFMTRRVAHRGGYVWAYLPDFSRRWGEMEAFETMIWVQPPGTATMGHLFLDAHTATGEALYLRAAADVAGALIAGQHPSGGWNYIIDTAGEESLARWYDTIGKNGWRLEEFHHYSANATFDDAGTAESSHFLLRLFLVERDARVGAALDRAIAFVTESQLPSGGWPQRFPRAGEVELHGRPDYTGYLTFNDDVARENLKFLSMVRVALGREDLAPTIARGRESFLLAQQPAPQAGWALQYDSNMQPAAARTYEPLALSTHTTAACIESCMDFYEETGDRRFLARVPEALAWLESVRLPEDRIAMPGRAFPTFIEIGTNRPLYVHRHGSNVVNGIYFADYDPRNPIRHYSQWRAIDLDALRARHARLAAAPHTPAPPQPLPRFFVAPMETSDLNAPSALSDVDAIVAALDRRDYWPTPLTATSNPYIGDGSQTPTPGNFAQTHVGDATDTSPYTTDTPVIGISISAYIQNMSTLIRAVAQ